MRDIDIKDTLWLYDVREVKKMVEEGLRIVYARAEALHPPLPRFTGTNLHELFVDICKRHKFKTFELLGDRGVRMETEDEREFEFERERIRITEDVRRSFKLVRDDFVDIFQTTNSKFDVPIHVALEVYIRALWPIAGGEETAHHLVRKLLEIKDDQLSLLGKVTIDLVGLRLIIYEPEERQRAHDLMVQPWPPDKSQLQVNLCTHFDQPVESAKVFGQMIDDTYNWTAPL
jgi:hypothetical protein